MRSMVRRRRRWSAGFVGNVLFGHERRPSSCICTAAVSSSSSSSASSSSVPEAPSTVALSSPRSVYIHIPFCRQRCHYCDFPIVVTGDHLAAERRLDLHEEYFRGLRAEIQHTPSLREAPRHRLRSVYFGGGTPSLSDPKNIAMVLDLLEQKGGLEPDCEVTLEMDPGTFDLQKAKDFRSAGVTRASVGAQTFHDDLLQTCGRAHSVQDTLRAVENLRSAGLDNFSLDLIGGLPNQTPAIFQASVEHLLRLSPRHASCYDLVVEDQTRFGRLYQPGVAPLPSDEDAAEMYSYAVAALTAAGFRHYETSNFAQPGFESVHNQVYWRNEPYYALGLGAVSFTNGHRFKRPATIRAYLNWVEQLEQGLARLESDEGEYTFQEEVEETLMLGLRTASGVSHDALSQRFNRSIADNVFQTLSRQDPSFVEITPMHRAQLTSPKGFLVQNSIIVEVLRALPFE